MYRLNRLTIVLSFLLASVEVPPASAAVTGGDGTIDIITNVATAGDTPEAALVGALGILCPKIQTLQDNEQPLSSDTLRLLEVCGILDADQTLTEQAYEQLSARSVSAITTVVSRGPAMVSLEDIGSRLAALRRAARNQNLASWQQDPRYSPLLADASLASISHHPSTTAADSSDLTGRSPSSRLDVVSTTPSPSCGPSTPSDRRLDALATMCGEKYGLAGATGGGASADEPGGLYDNRLSGFISGAYVNSEQTKTNTLAGFNSDAYGVTLGMDYRFTHNAYAGAATRLLNGNADLNDNAGGLDFNDLNLTLYGSYFPTQAFYLDATLQASRGKYELTRRIDFTVDAIAVNETAQGKTDGKQLGFSLGAGYEHTFANPGITAQLSATFRYNRTKLDSYTEQGAAGLNLNIDGQSIESQLLTTDAQLSKAVSFGWGVLVPQLNVAWKHEFKTDGEDISASFAADPFGTQFVFTTNDRDSDFFQLALGASTVIPGGWSGFAQLSSTQGYKNYKQNMVSLGVRKEF